MKFSEMSDEMKSDLMSGVKVGSGSGKSGRKEEVLGILKEGIYSVKELSVKVGVSGRNISSIVCYLRDDGFDIKKLNRGVDVGLVLWSKIIDGEKVGNRMELGKKGKVVRFNFDEGCFEDEIKKEVKKK